MHTTTDQYLMQIEPKESRAKTPIEDELTDKMESLLNAAKEGPRWRGVHRCGCGETSGNCDLIVAGYTTNSLAVHYLRWHRTEIPESEINKLRKI